jgi:hypothetical protein
MLEQLLPLLILSAIFGLYTIKCIVVYLWDESMRIAAKDVPTIEDQITLEALKND